MTIYSSGPLYITLSTTFAQFADPNFSKVQGNPFAQPVSPDLLSQTFSKPLSPLPRWLECFPEGVSRSRCCPTNSVDVAEQCFDELFTQEECCKLGVAMAYADSPPEPLGGFGLDLMNHPSFSSRQQEWEGEFSASSHTFQFQLRGITLEFYDFKWDHFTFPSILREIADDEYDIFGSHLAANDVVIDIGAHVGAFSIALARLHQDIRIVAIEPNPTLFRYMLKNLRENNVTTVVTAVNAGICNPGTNVSYVLWTPSPIEKTDVPCISLADIFALFHIKDVALMKIDCEGCEFGIFRALGASELVKRVSRLVGEIHNHAIFRGVSRTDLNRVRRIMCKSGNAVVGCRTSQEPILFGTFTRWH